MESIGAVGQCLQFGGVRFAVLLHTLTVCSPPPVVDFKRLDRHHQHSIAVAFYSVNGRDSSTIRWRWMLESCRGMAGWKRWWVVRG